MKSKIGMSIFSSVVTLTLFAAATAPMAHADEYTEALSINSAGYALSCSGCSGPYVDLTVDLTTPTTATITLQGLSNGTYQYLIGDDSQAAVLNVNASSFTVGSITDTDLSGFSSTYHISGTGQIVPTGYDDSGDFNFDLYGSGAGFSSASEEISFVLTDASGTWGSASEVLTAIGNGAGYDAAVPVYACSPAASCTTSDEVSHGVVDATVVPEPSSLLLMGTGLLGIGLIARRRFAL